MQILEKVSQRTYVNSSITGSEIRKNNPLKFRKLLQFVDELELTVFFYSYTGTCDVLGVFTGMERKRLKKMNHHGLKKIATRFTIVSDPNDGIAWKIYQNSKWVFEHPEKNSLYKKTINQFFEWDTITNESNCFSKFFVFLCQQFIFGPKRQHYSCIQI